MITYVDTVNGLTPENVQGFFIGWPNPPTPATHLKLLAGSDQIVLAVDDESGHVVGFVTAITDGVLAAFIPLLEVLPDYQGQGIGSELVQRMLAKLDHLYAVDVMCDADVQPFYARFGLQPGTGMLWRNYARQSGEPQLN